jgi:predicted CXXCH cytochrome family protein
VPGVIIVGVLPGFFGAAIAVMALCNPASGISHHEQKLISSPDSPADQRAAVCFNCHISTARPANSGALRWQAPAGSPDFECFRRQAGDALPINLSLMCLSCHDDVIAPAPPTSERWLARSPLLGDQISGVSRKQGIGHHPFRVEYPAQWSPDFQQYYASPMCELPLYPTYRGGSRVSLECPTCHDPHSPAGEPYLRVSSEKLELCLCCHRETPELSRQVYLPMQKEKKLIESGDCRSCHNK